MVSIEYFEELEHDFYDIGIVSEILDNIFDFYFSEYDHNNQNDDEDIFEDLYEFMRLQFFDMYENDSILCDIYDNIFDIIEYLDVMTLKYYERPLMVEEISSTTKIIDLMILYIFEEFLKTHNHIQHYNV